MNWHARTSDESGNGLLVIFHIPIPAGGGAGNNRAGVAYRTALVGSGIGGKTVMTTGTTAGTISAAELTQVQAGEIYEHVEEFATQPGEVATALRDRVDSRYAALIPIVQARLQRQLTYWGFDRNVP